MIDYIIFQNLSRKFTREMAKGNKEEAEKVIERLEKLYNEERNIDLELQIYFTIRGMKNLCYG